jgi:hypothetical protein
MQSPIRRTNMMARVGAIRQARDATPSPASGWRCPTRDFTHRPAGRAAEGPIHRPYSSIGTRCMHRPCAERGTKTIRSFVRDGARSTGLTPCATFVPSVGRGRGAVAFAALRAPLGSVCRYIIPLCPLLDRYTDHTSRRWRDRGSSSACAPDHFFVPWLCSQDI